MIYKLFLKKVFLLQILCIIIFGILLIYVEFFYLNRSLDSKKYLLKNNSIIYFAGDSRAQRGLNPLIAANYLNIDVNDISNIAVDGGDPTMIVNLIDENLHKFKEAIVFISISANQINDGANDLGRFTNSMISNLTLKEKFEIFFPEKKEVLLNFYLDGIKNIFPKFKDKFKDTNGFQSINDKYVLEKEKYKAFINHPWYKNWNSYGYKYTIIRKSLSKIKDSVKKVYLITAPYAPAYINGLSNDDILIEKKFKDTMYALSKDLQIQYIHYDNKKIFLNNFDFSDNTHLNKFGSEKFTKRILIDFMIK